MMAVPPDRSEDERRVNERAPIAPVGIGDVMRSPSSRRCGICRPRFVNFFDKRSSYPSFEKKSISRHRLPTIPHARTGRRPRNDGPASKDAA